MSKLFSRAVVAAVVLASLATLPALAQRRPTLPPGKDLWVTPSGGQTFFTFPEGDVESLCNQPASSTWNHQVALEGIPVPGTDYDTMVVRLDPAVFNSSGIATTRAQVGYLAMRSTTYSELTPCGRLTFQVGLSGPQAATQMTLRATSATGGTFSADLAVSVEIQAFEIHHGDYVGSLFYNFTLPDPLNGTPWSLGPNGEFRPGMTTTNGCIDVLRQKLTQFSITSSHHYFISNMIAQGNCNPHG